MASLLAELQNVSVFVFLICSMLATGLTLTVPAIIAPLRNLRLVLIALALNFLFAPFFAWLLTVVIPLDRGHAIGLLLLGGAAGAPFLPKVVETARGDLALSAALMGLLTLGTILFLPFALPVMIPGSEAKPWSIAGPLVLLIVLPLAGGMCIKSWAATLAARCAPVLAKIGNAALLLLFVLLVTLNFRALLGVLGSGAILACLVFFAGLFIVGWLVGGANLQVRGALGLSTTARNFGAALVPAGSSFTDPKVTIMIIVGAIVCLVIAFAAAGWVRRRGPV
jgi:BASS family bile acid:Na+ symporter